MAEELVEVVDPDGTVTGVVTRAEMRTANLRHRAVYVVVRTSAPAVVVHRRADWKDVWPGYWDLAFGGVVGVGEAWEAAAVRELAEEAGLVVPTSQLEPLGEAAFADDQVAVLGRVYLVDHDGPVTCPDGEVVEVTTVPTTALATWVASRTVCPDSAALVLPRVAAAPGPVEGQDPAETA